MFTQVDNLSFSFETKTEMISKNFLVIGDISFDKDELIFKVLPNKDELSFLFNVEIISNVQIYEGNYVVNIITKSMPTILSWLIGICFFPFGFITFFFAYNKLQKISDAIKLMRW
jgi:hypothetical protein